MIDPANHGLLLAAGIALVLIVSSMVAALLKQRLAPHASNDTIDNLITRINAWWAMAALLGVVFWLGTLATMLLFGFLSLLALREFMSGVGGAGHWITGVLVCVIGIGFIPALLVIDIPGYAGRNMYLVVFLLLVTQSSDVLQYIWGKLLGRHPVAPAISPSKTVEGLLGGVASATLLGTAVWWITPFTPVQAAGVALAITLLGFAGGLYLSAQKRARGIKDWGRLIKGHGGVLDRLDSLWLPAPVFFIYLKLGASAS